MSAVVERLAAVCGASRSWFGARREAGRELRLPAGRRASFRLAIASVELASRHCGVSPDFLRTVTASAVQTLRRAALVPLPTFAT
jgi:hypothetical protein